jgi:putative spermidine/putrescine transport system ATP-binding protein
VGVSNLISGPVAQAITGSPAMFSVRPEKIRLAEPGAPVPEGCHGVDGRIRAVVYLGMVTRYQVELVLAGGLEGGDLAVVEQNLRSTSMDALAAQGRPVRLIWDRQYVSPIGDGAA